ncbi:MAG TPA: type III-A CRISPR-associated protein Csm2 [Syntrophorhabdaceae bacterium]|nr:type III-A CRISPR-associated protein Csm2 [Syntrophorhabdaceae bacterium]
MEVNFWKDKDKQIIDPELFSKQAEELAIKIYKDQEESKGKHNKPTQLRKFYDVVLGYKSLMQGLTDDEKRKEEFEKVLPYIKMLNAKAAYAFGRDLISKSFKDFLSNSLKKINDFNDFKTFADFFESFMGFYKFFDEKGINQTNQGGIR